MNVTVVDGDAPFPPTSGKRLRSLHLLLPLARRHRLTYLFRCQPGQPDETRQAVEHLRAAGAVPLPVEEALPAKSGPAFAWRLARNLLSPLPYSVASHLGPRFVAAVRAHAATAAVDLWHLEWAGCFDALPPQRHGLRVVVDSHNVDTLIWQRYQEAERRRWRRWFLAGQRRKFDRFERRVFRAATRVVTVSAEDAVLVRERFGVERVDVVDNGIDRAFFEQTAARRNPRRILFLGSLDWRPNLDAVGLLLDDIFPAVRRAEPGAVLVLVGRHPPARLAERARATPGVELHADVPDVRPFLGGSGVLAVPLRIGGGSRLKILEALATGLPVVSTKVGAEGLVLRPGRDYTPAEPAEMAQALLDALRRPEHYQAQAAAGQSVVLDRYDWGGLSQRLERVWEKAMQD